MRFKRKKNVRQRGSKTHGWGAKKKHRGAGHRGGRGNAATGKRADSMNPSINQEKYFGKHGFVSKSRKKVKEINIEELQKKMKGFVAKGAVQIKNDVYIVNLKDIGYTKLLGNGKAVFKMEITADYASQNAIEKIKEAKGKVTVLKEGKAKKKGKGNAGAKEEKDEFEDVEEGESSEEDGFDESDEEEE